MPKVVSSYVGKQTLLSRETHGFSHARLSDFPEYIIAMLQVKMSAAQANKFAGA